MNQVNRVNQINQIYQVNHGLHLLLGDRLPQVVHRQPKKKNHIYLWYRVIQETVFFNLPLTDLTNQTNGITQWFLGSWYPDILIFWCLIIVSWKNLVFSGLSNNGIIGSILQGLSAQITPKHIWKPQASTNTIQIPSGNHMDTPQTSPYNTRHQRTATDSNRDQQTATDTNRRQQTPADSARCFLMSLAVSAGVCWCLLVSVGICWHLVLSGDVWGIPLEVSEGIWVVFRWIWAPECNIRCFVVRQLLLCIYALSSVKFPGRKMWLCKKSDKYEVCTNTFVHWYKS